jgi:hypothetical protein
LCWNKLQQEWCLSYDLYIITGYCTKHIKWTHNKYAHSVCPHVPSPKILNGFELNMVYDVYIINSDVNLVSVCGNVIYSRRYIRSRKYVGWQKRC